MSAYWEQFPDKELFKLLGFWEKEARTRRMKQERAIAHANAKAIIREQTRRHERRFGLD